MLADSLVEVGTVDEFPEGCIRVVKAARRELGVVRWAGSWFALRTTCPHQAASLGMGTVSAKIIAGEKVGEPDVEEVAPVIACPWHAWEFDLHDGRALCDPKARVATYPVTIQSGRVYVDLGKKIGLDK